MNLTLTPEEKKLLIDELRARLGTMCVSQMRIETSPYIPDKELAIKVAQERIDVLDDILGRIEHL